MAGLNIAKAFSTHSADMIDASGKGHGWWEFYACADFSSKGTREENMDRYLKKIIKHVTKEATPALQARYNELLEFLQDTKDFQDATEIICDKSVTAINFNQGSGTIFFYIYNFNPFFNTYTNHRIVKMTSVKMEAKCKLAKDWMIVTKVRSSFFKSSVFTELRYLEPKDVQFNNIAEAISMAFAPAILGLVQFPDRFLATISNLLQQQINNPSEGITPPSAEKRQQALDMAKQCREESIQRLDKAGEYTQKIDDIIKAHEEEKKKKKESGAGTQTQG